LAAEVKFVPAVKTNGATVAVPATSVMFATPVMVFAVPLIAIVISNAP